LTKPDDDDDRVQKKSKKCCSCSGSYQTEDAQEFRMLAESAYHWSLLSLENFRALATQQSPRCAFDFSYVLANQSCRRSQQLAAFVLSRNMRFFCRLFLCNAAVIIVVLPSSLSSRHFSEKNQASLTEIVAGMAEYHRWQRDSLREYQVKSKLYASDERSTMAATVEVRTVFHWPHSLQSMMVSQEGSSFLRERVFDKILAAEAEMAAKDLTDIVPQNYEFSLLGADDCLGQRCWHLRMNPKNKDKFLLEGELWVDAADYGVCRVHGSPSKRVSLWVSKVDIDKRLRRIEGIWLPERVESSMKIRFGDNIRMQIAYVYDNVKVITGTAVQK
jgi:hypothetical protein